MKQLSCVASGTEQVFSACVLEVFSVEQSVHFQYFCQVCVMEKNVTECLAKSMSY